MKKIFPGIAARLEFIVEDSDGLPVPSLAHGDTSSAGYRNCTDGVVSSTTSVSLTSSVAATAAVSAGQFVTIDSSRGHYAIDAPSGAAGSTLDYAEAVVAFTAGHTVTPVQHEIDLILDVVNQSYLKISIDLPNDIDAVASLANDIQSRIPAALVSGRMDVHVGAMAANVVTASALAADAVTEIQSGGGGLTPEESAQLTTIVAQTAKLSGAPVSVNGNVKPGGQIVLKHGDDHTVALGNPVIVPVDDVGGALHTLMAAVGVGNLSVVAIRGVDPASRVSGTVAALSYSSNVLSVTMQFTAAETVKGVVGPAYNYDVIKTDTPTRTYFSGRLTLTRDAR